MNDSAELDAPQTWLDRQVHARPELPYIAPFMTFLALMAVAGILAIATGRHLACLGDFTCR